MSGWTSKSLFVFQLLLAALLATSAARAEEIRIAGEYFTEEYALQPLQKPFKKATGINLSVRVVMIPQAFREIFAQSLDGFVNGLPDKELFEELKNKKVEVDTSLITSTVIAKFPVSVVVSGNNPLSKLSKEQIKAIFTGKIKDWSELGGKAALIRIVRPWAAPVRSALRYQLMDGEQYTSELIHPLSWETARQTVSESPGLITVLPTALVDGSVKALDTPEIAECFTVLTKGEPSGLVKRFIEYAKGDGQKYIDPLREYRKKEH